MTGEFKQKIVAAAVLGALGTSAHALEFTSGDWKLEVNGTVNAFYTQGNAETRNLQTGAVTSDTDRANIQNGLLPGWINFVASTKQKGFDIKAHFGFAPGINSNSQIVGLPSGANPLVRDQFSNIDSRNVYLQFGTPTMGSFKFGRDIGLFMQNPILLDMTLLGVGGTVRAAEPFNTTFGMIGHGYMYTGFQPQITYTTPSWGGFQASVGLFNPSQLDPVQGTEKDSPGIQGLASFDWKGSFSGKVWGALVHQKTKGVGGIKSDGFEGGVKVGFGPVEALVSGFTAEGLGISTVGAQFLGGRNFSGGRLESDGYFAQLTFKAMEDLKLGVNYGQNKDKSLNLNAAATGGADQKNRAWALGAYYNLTPNVTLVLEYIDEELTSETLSETKSDSVSFGAIMFF